MNTTLGEIMKYDPCGQEKGSNEGWDKLVSFLGTDDLSTEVTFRQILDSNGLMDTLWALRTQPYRDYCLLCAEVAESVLHLFEKNHPKDDRPRKCIEGIRDYHSGEISLDELKELRDSVISATSDAADAAMDKSATELDAAMHKSATELDAARAAVRAVITTVRAADATWAAASSASARAAESAAAWASRDPSCAMDKKLKEIEKLLLKYI